MARPQSEEYAKRRALIMDLAAELFATKRYHGASLRDLRRLANLTKGCIYHYYPQKEELLFDVIEGYLADYRTVVESLRSSAIRGAEVVEHLTCALLSLNLKRPTYLTVFTNDERHLALKYRATVRRMRLSICEGVEKILARSDKAPIFNEPRKMAALYLDAIGAVRNYKAAEVGYVATLIVSAFYKDETAAVREPFFRTQSVVAENSPTCTPH